MKTKRVFCGSISVKIDTKSCHLELADASLHNGETGLFRVRENRRWLASFYSKAGLIKIIEERLYNNHVPNKPNLRAKDRVSVQYKYDDIKFHKTYLLADPILTYQGIWVCPVFIFGLGAVYVNCDHVQFLRRNVL